MERVKRLARWIMNFGMSRIMLCSMFFLLFFSLIIYPGMLVQALQTGPTVTSQAATTGELTRTPTPTLEPEMEAPVGANAGLVCGAVSLVIIIIAGLVRSTRWIQYRGRNEVDKRT